MMTGEERAALDVRVQRSRSMERAEIREALVTSHARASIDRMLGEELIAAAREVVKIWRGPYASSRHLKMNAAIDRLVELVGRP